MKKRLTSLLLAIVLLAGLTGTIALAEEPEQAQEDAVAADTAMPVASTVFTEAEPNDNKTTANKVPESVMSMTGNLSSSSDVDWYEITLSKPGRVSFSFSYDGSIASQSLEPWRVQMYGADDTQLLLLDKDTRTNTSNSSNNYLDKGTYYFRVSCRWSNNFSPNNYTITVNLTENTGQFETENNDNKTTANAISISTGIITGSLHISTDVDWYKIELDKAYQISFVFSYSDSITSQSLEPWRIQMYGEDDTQLLLLDKDTRSNTSNSANNYLEKGTYYFRVSCRWSNNHSNSDYTLTVRLTENTGQFEAEKNDNKTIANTISSITNTIQGNLYKSDDADWYRVVLSSPAQVYFNFTYSDTITASTSDYWRITLFNSADEQITQMLKDTQSNTANSEVSTLAAGEYYISVVCRWSSYHSNSDYTLTMHIEQIETQPDPVTEFVTRLYRLVAEREPDEEGLNGWVNRLNSKEMTGAEVARGFFFSEEVEKRAHGPEKFATLLLEAMMGRTPSQDEINAWLVLDVPKGYTPRGYLFYVAAMSDEFEAICDAASIDRGEYWANTTDDIEGFVQRTYNLCLGRIAADAEMQDWVGKLSSGSETGTSIVLGFTGSQEFGAKGLQGEALLIVLFNVFLGRDVDEAGRATWLPMLAGNFNGVIAGVAGSQEFLGICEQYGIRP